jgi:hypothetical protein
VASRNGDGGSLTSSSDTIFGIGSGITAFGFWGVVVDVAQKYSSFRLSDLLTPDLILWLFSAIFIVGIGAMAAAWVGFLKKGVSRRRNNVR